MSRFSRFANLWRHRALDAEFDDELRFHFEMRVEKNLRRGMSRADAEREARRHLGSTLRAKEGMREARIMMWIETLFRDLAYGARMFRRQPGTTLLAVLTLSLGIGANAVIFSLLHAALIAPLPFPMRDRLVARRRPLPHRGAAQHPPTVPELLDVRAASRTLDPMSFYDTRDVQINGGTEPARAVSARIEADFFRNAWCAAGARAPVQPGDHEAGRDRVVILSDAFWRRNFGADPAVIDRDIIVNGAPHTIVGVLPPRRDLRLLHAGTDRAVRAVSDDPALHVADRGVRERAPRDRDCAAQARRHRSSRRMPSCRPSRNGFAPITRDLYRRGSDGQDLGFSMGVTPLARARRRQRPPDRADCCSARLAWCC